MVLANTGKNARAYLKTKRAGDMAQVVECLPSKHKALSSKHSTTKNKINTTNSSQSKASIKNKTPTPYFVI
jgi:hypothetical protein